MQRPLGVTILGILAIIGGVLGLCGGIAGLTGGALLASSSLATTSSTAAAATGAVFIWSIVLLALGVLDLVMGVGALMLKGRAWTLGIGLEAVSILLGIYNITQGAVGSAVVGIIIAGIILYYLFTPEVRKAFGR
jgi:hypothetical protein